MYSVYVVHCLWKRVTVYIVQFQKISILPPQKVYCFVIVLNSGLFSYIASKNLAFKTPSPSPLGISNDLPWGGYGYFLKPHIDKKCCSLTAKLYLANLFKRKGSLHILTQAGDMYLKVVQCNTCDWDGTV